MAEQQIVTAFRGPVRIASGPLTEVAAKAKAVLDTDETAQILIFDDASAHTVEVDFRGTEAEMRRRLERSQGAAAVSPGSGVRRGPGRPKLGVVAREVTLLPRHWDWLGKQPGGASVALRKLVEAARRGKGGDVRQAQDVAYRFMVAMAGDEAGFEEASRALFARDEARFDREIAAWPPDVRAHAQRLAGPVFRESGESDGPRQ
ncbi:hypothetical protein AUC69_15560 [Methyloceanibacter superfactus]|uniref:DUF2239 domain-containing protein n=1 Tax=Methyloceanibacter superfactus TaxID=1774969 RepID=A0A1E3VRM2_9HYPH|nr:DUF2239 family protein [Methyloceanibacter superfactus]ODR96175.1 hypothetical protein AUC69_15560 [Methyloceanibacter superfactus]